MRIALICRFADGGSQTVDDRHADLRDAIAAALDLADRHGKGERDEPGTASRFDVRVDGTLALSVAVLRGGLLAGRHD